MRIRGRKPPQKPKKIEKLLYTQKTDRQGLMISTFNKINELTDAINYLLQSSHSELSPSIRSKMLEGR